MIRRRPKVKPDGLPLPKTRSRQIVYGTWEDDYGDVSAHYAFVARHRCCVCGAHPVHVHHRLRAKRGMGTKASPRECVPLCPRHHLAHWSTGVHSYGSEAKWEEAFGVDLAKVARTLAAASVKAGRLKPEDLNKEAA